MPNAVTLTKPRFNVSEVIACRVAESLANFDTRAPEEFASKSNQPISCRIMEENAFKRIRATNLCEATENPYCCNRFNMPNKTPWATNAIDQYIEFCNISCLVLSY